MKFWWICAALLILSAFPAAAADYKSAEVAPDPPQREFRGVWIATVHNIDWPSKDNLSADEQKAEMIAILDRAVELKLNAVVLQVRGECDALYRSEIEPWCPWLTGAMGAGPGYDPLEFAVHECHKRGIELHAWFNPFRAVNSEHGHSCPKHVVHTHKEAIRQYGTKLWLEPTMEISRELALDVVRDVVRRYDIDAVHIDDYFYPYPVKNRSGGWEDFNDYKSWAIYQESGGKMTKGDWRRDAMNKFVKQFHDEVKKIKPACKVGVSPFGVYRPGQPEMVKNSLDSYATLYSDVKLWWNEGWMDYLAPQLYWTTDNEQLGFEGLYNWWRDENTTGRHLWPGIATYRIKSEGEPNRESSDTLRQVKISRANNTVKEGSGHLHFSAKSLMENRGNINEVLKNNVYGQLALPPESSWLSEGPAPAAHLRVIAQTDVSLVLQWNAGPFDDRVRWWLVQTFENGAWQTRQLLPAESTNFAYQGFPEKFAVTPVGQAGELGQAVGIARNPIPEAPVAATAPDQSAPSGG